MRTRTKLAALEKRMQIGDIQRQCPLCCTRPVKSWLAYEQDQALPPSDAPPCPLCGKRPMRIVVVFQGLQPDEGEDATPRRL